MNNTGYSYNEIQTANIQQNGAFVKGFAEFLIGWITVGCGIQFYNSMGNC